MRTKRDYKAKQRAFFIFFKGLSAAKNCHRSESAPLKHFPEKCFRGYCEYIGIYLNFIGQGTFSRIFENIWNKNVIFLTLFKIILINENPFLQMYHNEICILTYWFLRSINNSSSNPWKKTKETAIDKNIFSQIF